ncbi:DNA-binding response regulator [Candidatus Rhodobacter oscarellae]|uniref:DNA-binding response regulator n=1 Tax=Candidatus Rhodobacter oscarellae TaxID=1675527 RepID=A0A0J9EBE1_9RHOB|nr:response regulator transcription factor [Candidatus Rhodobacter lobularis]KMW60100.1 DNA-binding response regulator [Candidatus Rhodobacter lobularis]
MRVLLLEDDPLLAETLVNSFKRRGDGVDHASNVEEALAAIAVQNYDALILDIRLPDGSGAEVLSKARKQGHSTPIILITGFPANEDAAQLFDLGCDDYLRKPFDLSELHARLRAILRRKEGREGTMLKLADLTVDPVSMSAWVASDEVSLTPREYSLLEIFMRSRGAMLSMAQLFEHLYSFDDAPEDVNAVQLHIARLRKKIKNSEAKIVNRRGFGYQFLASE